MTDIVIRIQILMNQFANAAGEWLLAPIGFLPKFVGALLVAIVTGAAMLVSFKYTSNQSAIKRARNGIKAELLALSLFKENIVVSLRSQFRILIGALKLMLLSLVPMAFMLVPVGLLIGQLSLWWHDRPLQTGEEAVVTLNLAGTDKSAWPQTSLQAASAIETTLGPVQVRSRRAVCWNIRASSPGHHRLHFRVGSEDVYKDLATGDAPMRISARRPDWKWSEILLNPAESPLQSDSPVRSIEIQYPASTGWATGRSTWLYFWFLASTLAAFLLRGYFRVNL